jgi:hypothetical protein
MSNIGQLLMFPGLFRIAVINTTVYQRKEFTFITECMALTTISHAICSADRLS